MPRRLSIGSLKGIAEKSPVAISKFQGDFCDRIIRMPQQLRSFFHSDAGGILGNVHSGVLIHDSVEITARIVQLPAQFLSADATVIPIQ